MPAFVLILAATAIALAALAALLRRKVSGDKYKPRVRGGSSTDSFDLRQHGRLVDWYSSHTVPHVLCIKTTLTCDHHHAQLFLDELTVHEAIHKLSRLHEALRLRIHPTGEVRTATATREEMDTTVEVHLCSVDERRQKMEAFVYESQHESFTCSHNKMLWRLCIVCCCTSQDTWSVDVCVSFHHLVCDGASAIVVLSHFLKLVLGAFETRNAFERMRLLEEVVDIRPSVWLVIKTLYEGAFPPQPAIVSKGTESTAHLQFENSTEIPTRIFSADGSLILLPKHIQLKKLRVTESDADAVRYWSSHLRSQHHEFTLDAGKLRSVASLWGCTVNGVLFALVDHSVRALASCLTGATATSFRIKCDLPVSLRRLSQEELSEEVGLFIGGTSWVFGPDKHIHEGTNLLATLIHRAKFASHRGACERSTACMMVGMLDFIPQLRQWMLEKTQKITGQLLRKATLEVSNIGLVNHVQLIGKEVTGVAVESVALSQACHYEASLFCFSACTLQQHGGVETMFVTVSFPCPLVTKEDAAKVAEVTQYILGQLPELKASLLSTNTRN